MTNPPDLPDQPEHHRLRVSDADREAAAEVLRNAAGEGRITFEELDERLEAAYAAKTYGDLAAVTADLPAAGPQPPAVPAAGPVAGPGSFPAGRIGGTPGAGVSIAVMSGVDRAGPWVVPPRHTVFALMGGVQLDLREARFAEREVTIDVLAIMGGVDVIVGEDIEVDVSGFGFMGGFDHRAVGPGLPGAPRVRVVGFALMGGVNVQRRRPGKKQRQREVQRYGRDPDELSGRDRGELSGRDPGEGYGRDPDELPAADEYFGWDRRYSRDRERELRRQYREQRRQDRDLHRHDHHHRYPDPPEAD